MTETMSADRKLVQNDWRDDPDNPAKQHADALAQFGAVEAPSIRIPADIRALIQKVVLSDKVLNTWFRSLGVRDIERQLHALEMARTAVIRATGTTSAVSRVESD